MGLGEAAKSESSAYGMSAVDPLHLNTSTLESRREIGSGSSPSAVEVADHLLYGDRRGYLHAVAVGLGRSTHARVHWKRRFPVQQRSFVRQLRDFLVR